MNEQIYSPIIFIGREKEINIFEQMLDKIENKKWILNIYGDGGIGKTQLLHRFIEIIENRNNSGQNISVTKNLIDFYWTSYQRELGILKSIANQLDKNQFLPFYEALDQYEKLLSQPELPVAYLLREAADQVKNQFLIAYSKLQSDRIVLLFDTAESASDAIIRFCQETLPLLYKMNNRTFVVIAGRTEISKNLPPESITQLQVSSFSSDEVGAYFKQQGVSVQPEILDKVAKLSRGRPILLALTVDWINFGNSPQDLISYKPEQFERAMVERVQQLRYPEDHAILAMAHLQKRFDEHILAFTLEDLTTEVTAQVINSLSRFSFIKYRKPISGKTGSCLLHDEMRLLVNRYVWNSFDPLGQFRLKWSKKIIKYYDEKIKIEKDIIEKQHLNQERLYYLINIDLEAGFDYSRQLFDQAIARYDADFMEAINSEIQSIKEDLTPTMQREFKFRQAVLSHRHEKYAEAIHEMTELLDNPHCEPLLQVSIRARLIEFYTDSGNIPQAIEFGQSSEHIFEQILNKFQPIDIQRKRIERDFGILCNNLGYAYRSQGKLDSTVKYYNKSLEHFAAADGAYAQAARTKNNLGYVYHRLGRDDEALAECDAALRIRQRLNIPYELGLSYNVLGMIYVDQLRVEEATKFFELALQSFKEAGNERGRAMVYVAYGRLMRQWGWYKEKFVKELHDPCRKEYIDANRMLNESIKIFRIFDDLSNLSETLNEKGTLLRQQKEWDEAIKYYQESIKLTEKIGNLYRKADYLEDIAITYQFSGKPNQALKYAEQASELAYEINAHYLYARAQRSVADVLFVHGDYDRAFEAAGNACVNILRLDPDKLGPSPAKRKLLYEEWVDWVSEKILDLPEFNQAKEKAEYLIERWEQEGWGGRRLVEMFPGFIKTMQDRILNYKFLVTRELEDK